MANRIKTWITGDTLTAADLNAEFDNVYAGTLDRSAGRLGMNDDIPLSLGSSQDAYIEFNADQTNDTLMIGVDGTSNHLVLCQKADMGTDMAHAVDTDPALIIHSNDAATGTDWIKVTHDATDGVIDLGANDLVLQVAGTEKVRLTATSIKGGGTANNAFTTLQSATVEVTGMSGATATASNLIPAGATVFGVTSYVTTEITGCTSIDIGDGSDVDLWADGSTGLTAGSTTDGTDFTGTIPTHFAATNNVVITAVGGAASFSAGAIRLVVHYFSYTPPTS
jgi:hypothetical protein